MCVCVCVCVCVCRMIANANRDKSVSSQSDQAQSEVDVEQALPIYRGGGEATTKSHYYKPFVIIKTHRSSYGQLGCFIHTKMPKYSFTCRFGR